MNAPRTPLQDPSPRGGRRGPLHIAALFVVTLGAYWLVWLGHVYAELGRRAPRPTRFGPAPVLALELVPFLNLVWPAFLAVDLPRAIRRLGAGHSSAPDTEILSILMLLPVLGGVGIAVALGLSMPLTLLVAGYLAWPLELPAVLAMQRALIRSPGGSAAAARGGREVSLSIALSIAIVAALVATIAIGGGDEGSAPASQAQQVTEVSDIAATRDALWITNTVRGTVLKLDPRTRRPLAPPIRVGRQPLDIAAGEGGVWVANYQSGTVIRIDPASNQLTGPIRTGRGPFGVTTGDGAVWVSNQVERTVARIDPKTNRVSGRPVTVGRGPRGLAVGEGAVWVANGEGKSVSHFEPGQSHAQQTRIGRFAHDVAVGGGWVWATVPEDNLVRKIDPHTGKLAGAVSVLGGPNSVEVGFGLVWVASETGSVTRIDPRSSQMAGRPIQVGGGITDLTVGDDAVWVLRGNGKVARIPRPRSR